MDQALIEQLKRKIKADYEVRIEHLKKDMAAELDALSRLEPTLRKFFPEIESIPVSDLKTAKLVRRKTTSTQREIKAIKRSGGLSIRKLFKLALNKMPETLELIKNLKALGVSNRQVLGDNGFMIAEMLLNF